MKSSRWQIPVGAAEAARAEQRLASILRDDPESRAQSWQGVWLRKGTAIHFPTLHLLDLVRIDGFDTAWTPTSENEWLKAVDFARKDLGLKRGMSLLEVGCGCGAFLYPLWRKGVRVSGVDFSETMIAVAETVMPGADFRHAEARQLPFADGAFDRVASNGAFFYFPNRSYASRAFAQMVRVLKPGGRGLILLINDKAKKAFAERRRRELAGGRAKFKEHYRNLPHLYYDKDWFARIALKHGLSYEIRDHSSSEESSSWRFSFHFELPR